MSYDPASVAPLSSGQHAPPLPKKNVAFLGPHPTRRTPLRTVWYPTGLDTSLLALEARLQRRREAEAVGALEDPQ
jgi:hypothetical protein